MTILQGDVLERLRELPDASFGVVVTSPPYWGLRDYGVAGQLGVEPTMAEHLTAMVAVFAEVHRVLKPDGVCWVNYGDCYAVSGKGGNPATSAHQKQATSEGSHAAARRIPTDNFKAKDLCMIPNRFAIAMQDWGWWVRAECIWAKPNPMPESVTDRPATAHEKVFMFAKSARYFYDADVVRRGRTSDENAKTFRGGSYVGGTPGHRAVTGNTRLDKQRGHGRRHDGFNDRWDAMSKAEQQANGRNLRNYEPAPLDVWRIGTKPFSQAHFATFPPELVERCLKASWRKGDAVLDPFGGSGTTGLVAAAFGADCTLIELNPDYCQIARERLAAGLVRVEGGASGPQDAGPLFAGAA